MSIILQPCRDAGAREYYANNIVMPVWKIGCDELYESGCIPVDVDEKIQATRHKSTPALTVVIETVDGRLCSTFKSSNAHYFARHRKKVFKGD
jgi:hypothetical protein